MDGNLPRRFSRERLDPKPVVIECFRGSKSLFRIEHEDLVDEICESFGIVAIHEESGQRLNSIPFASEIRGLTDSHRP